MNIHGYCAMGCGETLQSDSEGIIECTSPECPNPGITDALLQVTMQAHHMVLVNADTFVIEHPIRERADGSLFGCESHSQVQWMLDNGVYSPGLYRFEIIESNSKAPGMILRKVKKS